MKIRYKATIKNAVYSFFICNWKGIGASLAWLLENAHIALNMFQNRGPFSYSSSALQLSFFDSHSLIVWILCYLKTPSLESFFFFLWLDRILLHKRKMAMKTRLFILIWIISFWWEMFFYICLLFSFDLKSFINPKTAWEGFNLTSFCGFLKNVSSKESVRPWFYVAFDIVISHNFPENFIKTPQFV